VARYVPLGDVYSGLVQIADYYDFRSENRNKLRTNHFDWNVRDYQGEVGAPSRFCRPTEC
jgi:hypothetical protein